VTLLASVGVALGLIVIVLIVGALCGLALWMETKE
jgi:hypothetical protein